MEGRVKGEEKKHWVPEDARIRRRKQTEEGETVRKSTKKVTTEIRVVGGFFLKIILLKRRV